MAACMHACMCHAAACACARLCVPHQLPNYSHLRLRLRISESELSLHACMHACTGLHTQCNLHAPAPACPPAPAPVPQYMSEKRSILGSLKQRAEILVAALNTLEGVTCNTAEGALYAFPRVSLPARAVETATSMGEHACFGEREREGEVTVKGDPCLPARCAPSHAIHALYAAGQPVGRMHATVSRWLIVGGARRGPLKWRWAAAAGGSGIGRNACRCCIGRAAAWPCCALPVQARSLTGCTARSCWSRRASWWCPAAASGRKMAPSTSGE